MDGAGAKASTNSQKASYLQVLRREKLEFYHAVSIICLTDRTDPYLSSVRREMFGLAYLRRNCASIPLLWME
jgi:hypothetical protein